MEGLAADCDVADNEAARRVYPCCHGLSGIVISIPTGRQPVEADAETAERPLVAEYAHQGPLTVIDAEAHHPAGGGRDKSNRRFVRYRFPRRVRQGNSRAHHDGDS